MALLAKQAASVVGLNPTTFNAANAGGDTVAVDTPNVMVQVKNGDASAKTVTFVRPGSIYGLADPDLPFTIAAGATLTFGPVTPDFVDVNGLLSITYSAVTSVTVAVFRI